MNYAVVVFVVIVVAAVVIVVVAMDITMVLETGNEMPHSRFLTGI